MERFSSFSSFKKEDFTGHPFGSLDYRPAITAYGVNTPYRRRPVYAHDGFIASKKMVTGGKLFIGGRTGMKPDHEPRTSKRKGG